MWEADQRAEITVPSAYICGCGVGRGNSWQKNDSVDDPREEKTCVCEEERRLPAMLGSVWYLNYKVSSNIV